MLCPECDTEISAGSSHCPVCNAPQAASAPERCAACNALITTDKHFCLNCGIRLARTVVDRSREAPSVAIDLEAAPFLKQPSGLRTVEPEVTPVPARIGDQLSATAYADHRRRRTIRTLAMAGVPVLIVLLAILSWSFWFSSRSAPIALVAEQSIVSVPPDGTVIVGATASGGTPENLVWKTRENNAGVVVPLGATAVGPRLFFRASYHAPKTRGEYHLIAQSSTPPNVSIEITVQVQPAGYSGSRKYLGNPSFDCGKAKTEVEMMICKDHDLSVQERQMAAAYQDVLTALPDADKQAFRRQHFEWFKSYTQACNASAATGTENDLRSCISRYLTDHTRELRIRTR